MIADRYSLDREIGRGGMGAVWLARDEVLGRAVAMKRIGLMPGVTTRDEARAQREARLAAMLNHPHVVAVFDLVEDDDTTWLVMEYVDGESLAQRLKREGAMSADTALPVITQCAHALVAAHHEGIVHRDVKPSNIMVTREGEAKLTDFGIARATADPALTQTGLVTGSPAYLAPEVASGRLATPASDVWSLGATLFHCLAGRPPYDVGDNLVGGLYKIVHEEPPRLRDAGALGPVLEGTMVREPERRWSMDEVLARLRALAAEDSPTRLMPAATPSVATPSAATPSPATPPVVQPPRPEPEPRPAPAHAARRGRVWPWLLAGLALVLVAVLGTVMLLSGGDDPGQTTQASPGPGSGSASGSASPSDSPSDSPTDSPTQTQTPDPAQTRAAMESFVSDYLATAPTDPRAAYARLTPGFQAASGNYGGYRGFWGTVASASLESVTADPQDLVVRYRVRYTMEDGRQVADDVQLRLVRSGDGFLIDGED